MTAPAPTISYLAEQITELSGTVGELLTQSVSYTAGTVTAVNPVGMTFTVNVPQPDGSQLEVAGINGISAQFMPVVGMTVNLVLSGAQLVYQPAGITPGSIGLGQASTNGPGVPGNVSATSQAITNADGTTGATISVVWTAPTTTTTGGPVVEAPTYVVAYKSTLRTTWSEVPATALTALVTAASGVGYDVKVASVDRLGNRSAFSPVVSITAGRDTAAPGQPSVPTVGNYLGQLKITWDGKLNGGIALPSDFARLEVYVSSTSGFTPSGTPTLVMPAGGSDYADVPYGSTRYVKTIAVDLSGNRSAPSAQASGQSTKVVSDDIFAGAVGEQQLAGLAVTSAKINLLAVNDAHIGNMSVAKLTTGIMLADVVIGGRFASALKGARTELNSLGFQKFNADESLAISLTATTTLLSGQYMTGLTGRRIVMGASGAVGLIEFIAPDAQKAFIKGYTEGTGIESLQLGMDRGGHYLWNRVNINDAQEIRADSAQMNIHFTTAEATYGRFSVNQYTNKLSTSAGYRGRFLVDEGGFAIWSPTGALAMDQPPGGGPATVRIIGGGGGSVDFNWNNGDNNQSPRISFYSPAAGGAMIKCYAGVMECRLLGDGGFASWRVWDLVSDGEVRAKGVVLTSDQEAKGNIVDATLDGAAAVKAMRVRGYKLKRKPREDSDEVIETPQIGLVAQELQAAGIPVVAPAGLDGLLGVDLYQLVSVQTLALQNVLTRLEQLEARTPKGPPS